jgi:hypothetical protein
MCRIDIYWNIKDKLMIHFMATNIYIYIYIVTYTTDVKSWYYISPTSGGR